MLQLKSALPEYDLKDRRVFLRADLNVPIHGTNILDDYRMINILPTIDYLLQRGANIILATHLGRPSIPDQSYSTKLLMPWFLQRNYAIKHTDSFEKASAHDFSASVRIILLENLRFDPGEKKGDPHFAKKLAHLSDFYVNDAFGACHESDASIAITPTFFEPTKRTIGFLIEKELEMLNRLIMHPRKPFTLIIGGNKVDEKLPVIKALLPKIDTVLLCPGFVFTLLKAEGKSVRNSFVDDAMLGEAQSLLAMAAQEKVSLVFPLDYYATDETFDGPLITQPFLADQFPDHAYGISIGPKTESAFGAIIKESKTIFYNGLMGDIRRPDTMNGTASLFQSIGESDAFSIIGGGDSVAAARTLGYAHQCNYLSTGGGATLAYLSGAPMPGLLVLNTHC